MQTQKRGKKRYVREIGARSVRNWDLGFQKLDDDQDNFLLV